MGQLCDLGEPPEVKADTKDGYSKVANRLLETLCLMDLGGRPLRFVMAVIRQTYGFSRKTVLFDRAAFSEAIGIDSDSISRLKTTLIQCKIFYQEGKNIGINPVISDWHTPEKTPRKTVKSDSHASMTDCQIRQEKLSNPSVRTGKIDSFGPPSSLLVFKENIKENFKEMSQPVSPAGDHSQKMSNSENLTPVVTRPDAAIQSSSGKLWGTQSDLDSVKFIFEAVVVRTMSTKEPNWADWANTIRLMREQDRRQPDHIAALFRYADQHDFWSSVILSPKALRKHWGKLAAAFNRHRAQNPKLSTREHAARTTTEERLRDTSWADGL